MSSLNHIIKLSPMYMLKYQLSQLRHKDWQALEELKLWLWWMWLRDDIRLSPKTPQHLLCPKPADLLSMLKPSKLSWQSIPSSLYSSPYVLEYLAASRAAPTTGMIGHGQESSPGNYSPLGISPECRVTLTPGTRVGSEEGKRSRGICSGPLN